MFSEGTFKLRLRREIEVHDAPEPVCVLVFKECGEGYDSYYMKLRKFMQSAILDAPDMLDKIKKMAAVVEPDMGGELIAGGAEVRSLHAVDDSEHEDESAGMAKMMEFVLGTSDQLEELVTVFGFMVSHKAGEAVCVTESGARIKEGAWKRLHPEDKISAAVQYCCFFAIGLDSLTSNDSAPASASPTQAKAL